MDRPNIYTVRVVKHRSSYWGQGSISDKEAEMLADHPDLTRQVAMYRADRQYRARRWAASVADEVMWKADHLADYPAGVVAAAVCLTIGDLIDQAAEAGENVTGLMRRYSADEFAQMVIDYDGLYDQLETAAEHWRQIEATKQMRFADTFGGA